MHKLTKAHNAHQCIHTTKQGFIYPYETMHKFQPLSHKQTQTHGINSVYKGHTRPQKAKSTSAASSNFHPQPNLLDVISLKTCYK